jgi:hypothetical protein
MTQETVRTKYQLPENCFNHAQNQECRETSQEADNELQDFVWHNSGKIAQKSRHKQIIKTDE